MQQFWSQIILVVVGLIFLVVQWIAKKDNHSVKVGQQAAVTTIVTTINDVIKGLEPHVERGVRTTGMIKELVKIHRASDDNGRPFVYVPKEFLDTQRIMAEALRDISRLMVALDQKVDREFEKFEQKLDHQSETLSARLLSHSDQCSAQFNTLDKKG